MFIPAFANKKAGHERIRRKGPVENTDRRSDCYIHHCERTLGSICIGCVSVPHGSALVGRAIHSAMNLMTLASMPAVSEN
ncbi:unnamed protein product [Fusarium graminearum]|nr:unnamed protein product [Fusarium graminearum]